LKTILDKYDDADLNNVVIEASRLPEILSSLVDNWDENELQTLISAVDEDGKGVSVFP
jgi:Ca2+-binding EF-hand superfamily protein